ncbi:MAG: hypothetical protein Fur0037_16920 [Planctomycetota bacterium]
MTAASILLAAAAAAQGTITGSAHDFSTASWNTGAQGKPNEACGACHIPHVEGRPVDRTTQTVLWGRQLTIASYTMYSSTSLDGVQDAQPSGSTRLCLGCHDGTVALELFHTRTTGSTFIAASAQMPGIAGSFAADHPISITYADGAGGDPGLRLRTTAFNGAVPGQTIEDVLEGGKVQCMSCHDPHNVQVPTGASYMLRIKNNDPANPSALCKACHIK